MTQYLLVILALLSILSYSGPDAAAADPFYHIRIGSPGGNSAGGSSSRSGYFQSTKSGTTSTNTNFSSGGSTSTNLTTGSATGGGAAGPDLTIPNTVTHLVISNKTGNSVTMGLQCQVPVPGKPFIVQDGCTQIIDDMRIINLSRGGTTD
ncbi:MAG: hypothetical protein K8F91_19660, partial [Candidatus Obscuribacterales bacterium]|nr:hypothetical protein [Candidatus Obscuribacterales bacterium]